MSSQIDHPINGNDMLHRSMSLNGIRRHRHFKYLFAIQDVRINIPSRENHPNWKKEPILKHALKV